MSLLTRRGCCCFTHDRKEYFLRLENVRKSLLATERRIKKKKRKRGNIHWCQKLLEMLRFFV